MEGFAATWEDCNSMLYTHNWWHIALYYLKRKEISQVLALYDTKIWGRADKESSKDQIGAISLLLRLELSGVDVGDRWQAMGVYLIPRIHEHALPFQDIHYVYALERSGQAERVTGMLWSMQAHANNSLPYIQKTWLEVATPAAQGMVAHAKGEWEKAIARLKPILPRLYEIGGSHAQCQLFEQVYYDSQLGIEQDTVYHLAA